jgi:hypothetical protein
MTIKLDFEKTIQQGWHFWGMKFDFTLPGPDQDILDMQPSISSKPGEEPWGFYEYARDIESGRCYSTGQYQIMDMESLSSDQINQMLPSHKLHFSRRRFNHSWFVEYAGRIESFWFDIWIHRVQADCNLLDAASLQQAHLGVLADSISQIDNTAEDELFGADLEPDWQALNWRRELINGLPWQAYDEIGGQQAENSFFFGHSYLLPLTQHHYIQFRFYRLNASLYREAASDFEQLVQFITQKMKIRLNSQTTVALNNQRQISLAQPDLSKQLSSSALKKWKELDKNLREKNYLSSAIADTPATENKTLPENRFALAIGVVAIIIFVCLGKGYFFIQDWLDAHPDSQWHWASSGYFVVVLIWCLRDRIKKWA